MKIKYNNIEIDNEIIKNNLKRLINQIYKLLPNREEGLDWQTPLSTIIQELIGMNLLFDRQFGEEILALLSKLEGLYALDKKDDFFNFRRTIFECLNLMDKIKNKCLH